MPRRLHPHPHPHPHRPAQTKNRQPETALHPPTPTPSPVHLHPQLLPRQLRGRLRHHTGQHHLPLSGVEHQMQLRPRPAIRIRPLAMRHNLLNSFHAYPPQPRRPPLHNLRIRVQPVDLRPQRLQPPRTPVNRPNTAADTPPGTAHRAESEYPSPSRSAATPAADPPPPAPSAEKKQVCCKR